MTPPPFSHPQQILHELEMSDVLERCPFIPKSVSEYFPDDIKTAPSYQFISKLFQKQVHNGMPTQWKETLNKHVSFRMDAVCRPSRRRRCEHSRRLPKL